MLIPITGQAYNQTYNVKVGDTFTVHTTYRSNTTAILWTIPYDYVEPVGSIGPATTSVTFRAKKAISSGVIIQAVTYVNYSRKYVDDWLVRITNPNIEPIAITISPSSKTINVGDSFYASYTLTPSNATTTVTWSSENNSIATVTQSGLVTGVAAGTTWISVETANGKSDWFKITVNAPSVPVESVTIDAPADSPVFSLSGQRLAAPKKGINIIGGKKVVVK